MHAFLVVTFGITISVRRAILLGIRKYEYELVWCFLLAGLFIALSFTLGFLDYGSSESLSFMMGVTVLVTDGFLCMHAKIGLQKKRRELNQSYNFLKKLGKTRNLVFLSRLAGNVLFTLVLVILRNVFFLLIMNQPIIFSFDVYNHFILDSRMLGSCLSVLVSCRSDVFWYKLHVKQKLNMGCMQSKIVAARCAKFG